MSWSSSPAGGVGTPARAAARPSRRRDAPASHRPNRTSPGAAPIGPGLRDVLERATLAPPSIPYLSNVTGDWMSDEDATDPEYWVRHACSTVRFSDGMRRLLEAVDIVIEDEAGPRAHRDRPPASRRREDARDLAAAGDAARRRRDRIASGARRRLGRRRHSRLERRLRGRRAPPRAAPFVRLPAHALPAPRRGTRREPRVRTEHRGTAAADARRARTNAPTRRRRLRPRRTRGADRRGLA